MISSGNTSLFATEHGFIAIDGDVKLKIMELLEDEARSFDEIVKHTGKSKSTVSVHLKDLRTYGMLKEMVDPNDRRKKIYSLCSRYISCSQEPVTKHYNNTLEKFASVSLDEYDFIKYTFHALRCGLEAQGINTQPLLKLIGKDIGTKLATNFKSRSLDGILGELSSFWSTHRLGTMSVPRHDPLSIRVDDCFDCGTMPPIDRTLCSFDEGILEAVMLAQLGIDCTMKETECYGTGYDHCLFVMQ
ncbi:MAG: V4R domain-containing protein [Euryarchaeota archaeon]|nr:V4R domain-containing protein [Euryarchaeota archaeon]